MKNKFIIFSFLGLLFSLCSIYIYNYISIKSKNMDSSNYIDYVALTSTEALKSISIKKELIDAKDYYKAGDDIKYNITITNNNSEAVTVNLEDNYNNVENTQRNIVIESVSCNNKAITPSSNKVLVNNITIAANGTYKCTIDAYAKKGYTEGKVNSRAKVYVDDEDEYQESGFTYLVRDTDFDIQIDKVDSFSKFNTEELTYNFKIKNLNSENKSGKVELKLYLSGLDLIMDEPYADNYSYTFSGASKELITSKVKFECLTHSGEDVCVPDKSQMLKFTITGLNPSESADIKVKLKFATVISAASKPTLTTVIYGYNADNSNWIKYYKKEHNLIFTASNSGDTYGEVYVTDSSNNIISDLHDVEFMDSKAELYLHYNYYRVKEWSAKRNDGTGDQLTMRHILPSNVLYDKNREFIKKDCNPFNFTNSKTSSGLIKLATVCGLDTDEYFSSVDVPIIITKSMLNKNICLSADTSLSPSLPANNYCIGPQLGLESVTATQDKNKVVTVKFIIRNYANGYGKDAKVTMTYNSGMTVNTSSLDNAVNNATSRIITWTLPYIAPYRTNTITFKINNPNDLSTLNATFNVEGTSATKAITITKPEVEVTPEPDDKEEQPESTPTYVKGDWNQDGVVTQTDLMYARQYLAKVKELKLPPVEIYDFNGDNKAGISDINGLRKLLVDMDL